ncbi:MAG TPA: FKBP-type peptidyl-prolyl cis-trans isomerase [Puia sp.]|nr:FKBP-type peptidyl-prolyl cis-trans isomerase [Puia sp.]
MKKWIICILAISVSTCMMGQVKKKPAAVAHATPAVTLKTVDDSISYAIGLSAATFFKQQNIKNVNTNLVSRAIQDIMKNTTPLLTEQQSNAVIMACVGKIQAEKEKENSAAAEGNKKLGEAFLADNKTKPGVVSLPSGLQYQVLTEGSGPKPSATDKIKCHYQGSLLDGTIFDSSIQRGEPLEITVNHVIAGWTEALQLMPVGSKWRLFIPANLAYGDRSPGPTIKPGSTLIFEVELLEIVK